MSWRMTPWVTGFLVAALSGPWLLRGPLIWIHALGIPGQSKCIAMLDRDSDTYARVRPLDLLWPDDSKIFVIGNASPFVDRYGVVIFSGTANAPTQLWTWNGVLTGFRPYDPFHESARLDASEAPCNVG